MANLLSLRATRGDVLVRFDAVFLDERVAPLLKRQGFSFSLSATSAADLRFECDDGGLERFLAHRAPWAPGRVTASAVVWRALVVAAGAPPRPSTSTSRDLGGTSWSPATKANDVQRGPGGRRVKGRARVRTLRVPSPPGSPAITPAGAGDPAAFALQALLRLARPVAALTRDAADAAMVVVDRGVVVLDGVEVGRLPGGAADDRRDGP